MIPSTPFSFDIGQKLSLLGYRLPVFVHSEINQVTSTYNTLAKTLTDFGQTFCFIDAVDFKLTDKINKTLGAESGHIILDVTQGFDLKLFMTLAGKIKAGHILFCLLPKLSDYLKEIDKTSLNWISHAYDKPPLPVTSNLFKQHFYKTITGNSPGFILSNQTEQAWHDFFSLKSTFINNIHTNNNWLPPTGKLNSEQECIFGSLCTAKSSLYLISAMRGRGKSFLIARFFEHLVSNSISVKYTAPKKSLLQTNFDSIAYFIAPDQLSLLCEQQNSQKIAKWLIVDEAAMMPIAKLKKWLPYFEHVVLTTTLEGYEGTGHGLRLKFINQQSHIELLHLTTPIRFNHNDPLELLAADLYLANMHSLPSTYSINQPSKLDDTHSILVTNKASIEYKQGFKCDDLILAKSLYLFFAKIHYQTSPNDLRRLFDDPSQHFFYIENNSSASLSLEDKVAAAAWVIHEGGASYDLANAIWMGTRRPQGNLVAQSLAIHADSMIMPTLIGLRISRIGVSHNLRRHKIASNLIESIKIFAYKKEYDYLSVSFGYEPHLVAFWAYHEFKLVHVSHKADASSGQLSCMMIFPISTPAKNETNKLALDLSKLQSLLTHFSEIAPSTSLGIRSALLNTLTSNKYITSLERLIEKSAFKKHKDVLQNLCFDNRPIFASLIGFACHGRSFEASRIALSIFLEHLISDDNLDLYNSLNEALSQPNPINKDQTRYLKDILKQHLKNKNLLHFKI
ncbi:GNAT family N-acetyltransferase [Thorsellia anophelis]|uniref:tRNA(Met)-cytidine N(4)-acetyltransferase n=1 Tax=Thorsellia anophelis DSM 18579 TaxID=1123402 RepID=A0A1I0FY90_9GAMM|nr:GNAT family N-acetyltransferase [Thorsellia anophelis]SET63495.1 tRNA(Met)-cytidine N(4)-acetyltransferase [Thorsellia anophelis DSM 18579]